ncbi:hypothetical protein ABKN59_011090 [Abortiporus biennis]
MRLFNVHHEQSFDESLLIQIPTALQMRNLKVWYPTCNYREYSFSSSCSSFIHDQVPNPASATLPRPEGFYDAYGSFLFRPGDCDPLLVLASDSARSHD